MKDRIRGILNKEAADIEKEVMENTDLKDVRASDDVKEKLYRKIEEYENSKKSLEQR